MTRTPKPPSALFVVWHATDLIFGIYRKRKMAVDCRAHTSWRPKPEILRYAPVAPKPRKRTAKRRAR